MKVQVYNENYIIKCNNIKVLKCFIIRSLELELVLCVHAKSISLVWLFVTPWTTACQAPLSIGFPRQEYWSGLPFCSPVYLPDLGIEPVSPALTGRFFTTEPFGKPRTYISQYVCVCVCVCVCVSVYLLEI